jgi:hypothetical protein
MDIDLFGGCRRPASVLNYFANHSVFHILKNSLKLFQDAIPF